MPPSSFRGIVETAKSVSKWKAEAVIWGEDV
jgi:hypothetical protein